MPFAKYTDFDRLQVFQIYNGTYEHSSVVFCRQKKKSRTSDKHTRYVCGIWKIELHQNTDSPPNFVCISLFVVQIKQIANKQYIILKVRHNIYKLNLDLFALIFFSSTCFVFICFTTRINKCLAMWTQNKIKLSSQREKNKWKQKDKKRYFFVQLSVTCPGIFAFVYVRRRSFLSNRKPSMHSWRKYLLILNRRTIKKVRQCIKICTHRAWDKKNYFGCAARYLQTQQIHENSQRTKVKHSQKKVDNKETKQILKRYIKHK